jgi:hypothetical protein
MSSVKKGGLVAGAENGDISETGIEKVGVDAGVGIYQDAFCREALRAVTSDCTSVVKIRMTLHSYLNRCTLPCRSKRGMDAFRPH